MTIDTSRLSAAIDAHTKSTDELRSLATHLASQNAELIARLEAAYAHSPATADHVGHQAHLVEVQKQVVDLAARLEASAAALGDTVANNQPGAIPTAPPVAAEEPKAA